MQEIGPFMLEGTINTRKKWIMLQKETTLHYTGPNFVSLAALHQELSRLGKLHGEISLSQRLCEYKSTHMYTHIIR